MAHDVFISHSSVNKAIADAVCATLEGQKIRCWIAPRDVLPGNTYTAEIIRGIEESKIIVFIVSSSSNRSGPVYRELERAVSHGKIIIPFRLEDIRFSKDVEFLIAGQHWIDAINPPLAERIDELAGVIKRHLDTPSDESNSKIKATDEKAPAVRRSVGIKRLLPFLVTLVLVSAAGAGGWFFFHQAPIDYTVQLNQPADGQVIIGDRKNPSLNFSYTLPSLPSGLLNEQADIQISPDGNAPTEVQLSSPSCPLPAGLEGPMKWKVRATWENARGATISGPWSPEHAFAFYRDRLRKILLTGQCVIGTADLGHDDKATNFNQKNQPGGYEVDLLQAFFEQAALEGKTPPKAVVISSHSTSGTWGDDYFHMLQHYQDVDMLVSGITPTKAREQAWQVVFTEPSLTFYNVLVVLIGTKALDHGTILLKTIGVAKQTTNQDLLNHLISSDRVIAYKAYDVMADALSEGYIDGFLIDETAVPGLEKRHSGLAAQIEIKPLDPTENNKFTYSSMAYALRPFDDKLLKSLNKFIETDTEVRKKLLKKYFADLVFPNNPSVPATDN